MSLFNEHNTAFRHSLWDRYEFTSFLDRSHGLKDLDFRQRTQYQYSTVQDAYYALMGRSTLPNLGNAAVTLWEMTVKADWFKHLQTLYKQDRHGKRLAVKTLADIYTLRIFDNQGRPPSLEMVQQREEIQKILNQLKQIQPQASEEQDEGDDQTESQLTHQKGDPPHDDGDQESTQQAGGAEQDGQPQAQPDAGNNGQKSQQTGMTQPGQRAQSQSIGRSVPSVSDHVSYQDIGPAGHYTVDATPMENNPNFSKNVPLSKIVEAEQRHDAITALLPYMGEKDQDTAEEKVEALLTSLDAKAIAKFLGFAQRAVRGAHRLTDSATGELTKYKQVVWSEKLHPVDMVGVANGDPRTLVRMAEGNLRARHYEDKSPKGRGPVIVLRDETGSMSSRDRTGRGTNNQQARALEVALAHAFNLEKRDLVSIAWGDTRTRLCVYGEDDVAAHLNSFLDGTSTYIEQALELGVAKAKEYVDGADILVITDGLISDARQDPVLNLAEVFHKTNGRIWCVLIGDPKIATRDALCTTLEQTLPWADGIITVDKISDNAALSQLLTRMNRRELNTKGKKVTV